MAIIFEGNFKSDLSDFVNWRKELCCSHSGNIDRSIKHGNNNSFRFVLKKKDPLVSTSKRAEISNDNHKYKDPIGSERWYGFSVYLPNDWVDDVMKEIVHQWHATPDCDISGCEPWRPVPAQLMVEGKNWIVCRRYETSSGSRNYKEIIKVPYKKGVWTDWVYHIIWKNNSSGLIEVWKDGTKLFRLPGNIGYNDKNGIFWKFGIYKWGWLYSDRKSNCTTRTIYHALIKIGDKNSNYNEVTPSSSTPFPTPTTHYINFTSTPPNAYISKI